MGRWVASQRVRYKSGKLSEERIEKLKSLDFKWESNRGSDSVGSEQRDKWEEKYILLEEYFVENNHVDVPDNYESTDGSKLGRWVQRQRGRYKSGKLLEERIEKLKSLGFKWGIVNTDKWEDIYILLEEYFVENNHVDVPYNYESKQGVKLGAWVSRQRVRYKSEKLSEERIEKLESLGFKWEGNRSSGSGGSRSNISSLDWKIY